MTAIELALISACFTELIMYGLGLAKEDFSPNELFSWYTFNLSVLRLKRMGELEEFKNQLSTNLKRGCLKKYQIYQIKKDWAKLVYNAASPFFTWEKAFGMCAYCTGFWVAVIIGIITGQKFIGFLIIIVISHAIIRVFKKFL